MTDKPKTLRRWWHRLTPWIMAAMIFYFSGGREIVREGGSLTLGLYYGSLALVGAVVLLWVGRESAPGAWDAKRQRVITLLRDMDAQQQRTDDDGGREIAWYHWRDDLAHALGVDPRHLDNPPDDDA